MEGLAVVAVVAVPPDGIALEEVVCMWHGTWSCQ